MNPNSERGKFRELQGTLSKRQFEEVISRSRFKSDTVNWLYEYWVEGKDPDIDRRLLNNKNRVFKKHALDAGYYWL